MTHLSLLLLAVELLLAGLLFLLLPGEVLVVELGDVNAGDVDLGGGGDHVAGIDAADWDTVDLEGTGDEKNAVGEGLEVDDALSTEAASEDDEDGAGDERGAEVGWARSLASLQFRQSQVPAISRSPNPPAFPPLPSPNPPEFLLSSTASTLAHTFLGW